MIVSQLFSSCNKNVDDEHNNVGLSKNWKYKKTGLKKERKNEKKVIFVFNFYYLTLFFNFEF